MKGLKKLALATAVAAAPFAQAEMTALDDSTLSQMTGQAGITIDVDLDMSIDAIKYVDRDGNAGGSATQGAITMKGITMDNDGAAARIRGITIDADGQDGLVIGLNQIGDTSGNGIDITVDAVMINDGQANLTAFNAVDAVNQTLNSSMVLSTDDLAAGTVATALGDALTADYSSAAAANATDAADLNAAAGAAYGNDGATLAGAALSGDATAQGIIATEAGNGNTVAAAAAAVLGDAAAIQDPATQASLNNALAAAGAGNIGGFKIENFRNYIQDSLVEEYNGVFDMALQNSTGAVVGDVNSTTAGGRFVRGEITIQGTGNYLQGTSGLNIAGEFGGAIDQAAWVDEGNEFGIADLGFFHGVDTNSDGISDTIEGMHFTMDIDVVQHQSWNNTTTDAGVATEDVAALQISGLEMKGTIMMGSLYLDGTNMVDHDNDTNTAEVDAIAAQSLGSVLIKDIDMTGTSVYIYGH